MSESIPVITPTAIVENVGRVNNLCSVKSER